MDEEKEGRNRIGSEEVREGGREGEREEGGKEARVYITLCLRRYFTVSTLRLVTAR